jgi:predicted lactoylglutathione lyase
MRTEPTIISLATDDRRRSFDFYRDALGLVAIGEPADDGVPEPLQFELGAGVNLMLVPRGGFGWIIGDNVVAERGTSECLLSLSLPSEREVDELVERAIGAGATVVSAAGPQPWGYAGTFADPDGHLWMIESTPP